MEISTSLHQNPLLPQVHRPLTCVLKHELSRGRGGAVGKQTDAREEPTSELRRPLAQRTCRTQPPMGSEILSALSAVAPVVTRRILSLHNPPSWSALTVRTTSRAGSNSRGPSHPFQENSPEKRLIPRRGCYKERANNLCSSRGTTQPRRDTRIRRKSHSPNVRAAPGEMN